MKTVFNGIRIDSRYHSVRDLRLDMRRKQRLQQLGWNLSKLNGLMRDLKKILLNFEKICKNKIRFNLIFLEKDPEVEKAIFGIDPDQKEIYVYLKQDPSKILENLPPDLSRELALILYKLEIFRPGEINLLAVEKGFEDIVQFYSEERGLELNRDILWEGLTDLIESYCLEIEIQKRTFLSLCPHFQNRKHIELLVDNMISEILKNATSIEVEMNQLSILSLVASLAMLSALAAKQKCFGASSKCQGVLFKELGEHLAMIEMLEMPPSRIKHFQENRAETDYQLYKAIPGYNHSFNILKRIFESHYDGVETTFGG